MAKVWRVTDWPPAGFANSMGLPAFQAHLLYNRGIHRRNQLEPFLAADSRLSHDPMLLTDMERAVDRLRKACTSGETIGVFGDFDADGVTGTAVLMNGLQELEANVVSYLPHRVKEGHGLNERAIREFHDLGASVLVTVDCGVSSHNEVSLARSMGMDTIITDHHSLPPTLPEACAIIHHAREHSGYPYPHLTGVGVAFKLVEALWTDMSRPHAENLLELVAIGTVADIAPLNGENRYLVKKGLELLNHTSHVGIRALIDRAGLHLGSLDTRSLSYGLIPRLNAPGRLGHAKTSLDLLTTTSQSEAQRLAEELERHNSTRQRLTEQSIGEALSRVEGDPGRVPSIIIARHEDWSPGILGLVAGRLSEHYNRPALAISVGPEVSQASARSIPEFDIIGAFRAMENHFIRYGGHSQAAGFATPTAELPAVMEGLSALADAELAEMDLTPTVHVDCEIPPAVLTQENLTFMQSLEPFGEGNPEPLFLTSNTSVVDARRVGSDGRHLKMRVAHGGMTWDAIAFRQGERLKEASGIVDLVYTAAINDWGGRRKVQLNVQDFRSTS